MANNPTRPAAENLRFRSGATGTHVLDDYMEASEIGGKTLPELMSILFTTGGDFDPELISWRVETESRIMQFRVGSYADPNAGWMNMPNGSFFAVRGEHTQGETYVELDLVSFNSSLYLCAEEHVAGSSLDITKFIKVVDGAIASAAQDAANDAFNYMEKARQWAEQAEGVEVDPGEFSAKHYALLASDYADQAATYRDQSESRAGYEIQFKSANFTTERSVLYVADGGLTATLHSDPVHGDQVAFGDRNRAFGGTPLTVVGPIEGDTQLSIDYSGAIVHLVYNENDAYWTIVSEAPSPAQSLYTVPAHTHDQSAINGLVTALAGKAAVAHTHPYSDVPGLQADLDGKAASVHTHFMEDIVDFDALSLAYAPLAHTHAVADVTGLQAALDAKLESVAVADVTGLQATLDSKAPLAHSHVVSEVTGLQAALDAKAATSHGHDIASVSGLQSALDGKAAAVHVHAIASITGLQAALDGKANTVHEHNRLQNSGLTKVTATSTGATVTGTLLATNVGATASDIRLKTDLSPIVNALALISSLRGYRGRYLDSDDMRFFLLAQEAKTVMPELIIETEDGYLALNYEGMVPVLMQCIHELTDRIEALEDKE